MAFLFSVCRAQLDLGFLIDGSGSIEKYGRGNFKRCLRFVQNTVSAFRISRHNVRVGAVLYSSRPYKIFGLNKYNRKSSVLRAIRGIRYPQGGTRTGLALHYTRRRLFGRSRRKKVLIVMTDGRSQDNVLRASRAMKRRRVEVFSVGIGTHYSMRQLRQIASDHRHVLTADFRNLNSIIRAIKERACKGKAVFCYALAKQKSRINFIEETRKRQGAIIKEQLSETCSFGSFLFLCPPALGGCQTCVGLRTNLNSTNLNVSQCKRVAKRKGS